MVELYGDDFFKIIVFKFLFFKIKKLLDSVMKVFLCEYYWRNCDSDRDYLWYCYELEKFCIMMKELEDVSC